MSDCRFVHLKVHSDFSMINGLAKVKSLVKTAVANNMVAMGLTDFTNFCGLVKFYGEALGAGIKPIIGADVYVRTEAGSEDYFELTLLAKNNKGYHNITQILSKAYQQGYIEFPMVEREWLAELNEGIIILSGGRMGDVGKALLKENRQEAEEKVAFYQQYYPNHFYLSVCRTGRADEERYIKQAVEFSQKNAIPLVAVNDVVFLKEDDFDAHEIRVAIHDSYTLDDPKRPKKYSPKQYFRTEEEMCKLFADLPSALANTVEIAKRCSVTVRLGEYFLPNFPTGELSTKISW